MSFRMFVIASAAVASVGWGEIGNARAQEGTNTISCTLTRDGEEYRGPCAIPCAVNALAINIAGQRSDFACFAPDRVVEAKLRRQERFDDWLGSMQGKEPEDPTRFGLITPRDGNGGTAKTPYGWFAIGEMRLDATEMALRIIADRQLPPTEDDRRIIRRAIELIPSREVWNKQDDRKCSPQQTKISLFCAMMQATTETTGGVHYRQPAMQAVREVLNEVGGDRVKLHRIMDYNNHPDTKLEDIHALLQKAEAKLRERGM
ncbi:DUF6197 family protein [Bosea sp. (in: a-proteobacteria)]|uniref:DUF6197 family protein n=1 Tax=Bosea sp. (in: a-proteobacteria) TaxID=1871050 RepID=UPI002B470BF6|nr:hypothetical protein [Bosea sp. (in: a-proteobacteria)]WRH56733.1 MAG: hypothetical protein RSE11_17035 [Bosea sp. (in: a-proteobacteria)]